jgi:hypothetical protein
MLTAGADQLFHLMLSDRQTQNGQVMALSPFLGLTTHCSQLALAGFAVTGPMDHYLIGRLHPFQRVSGVAWLPTLWLAARFPLLSFAFEAITRWRLTAVLALFRQSPLSLLNSQQRTSQQSFEFLDALIFPRQGFFAFCVLFSPLARFLFCHARRLPALASPLKGTWVVTMWVLFCEQERRGLMRGPARVKEHHIAWSEKQALFTYWRPE